MLPCRQEKELKMTTAVAARLPHWDMSRIFPALESEAFEAAFKAAIADVADLVTLYDRHDVRKREGAEALSDKTVAAVDEIIQRTNELAERLRTVYAYLHSFVSTNSRNDFAQAKVSELQGHAVEL